MKNIFFTTVVFAIILSSCSKNEEKADAYGNFQTKEILVSPEVAGKIVLKNFEEGDVLNKNDVAAVIDTTQLVLQLNELEAKKNAAAAKKINIRAQVKVQQQQKSTLQKDLGRFRAMLKDAAATPKQVDDIEGNIAVIDEQISSIRSNLVSIDAEVSAIEANIAKTKDMVIRSVIQAPRDGTVLESYAEAGEIAVQGKPLFKMADMQNMELVVYISGNQLSAVKLGQQVRVKIDGASDLIELPGKVTWIASDAEFTPKNIQTREERVNQVYAMKVLVKNDGQIKINMPGEVYFHD